MNNLDTSYTVKRPWNAEDKRTKDPRKTHAKQYHATLTVENQWIGIRKAVMNSAEEMLRKKKIEKEKEWVSEEEKTLSDERKKIKNRNPKFFIYNMGCL